MATITKNDIKNINEKFEGENIDKMFSSGLLISSKFTSATRAQMVSSHLTQYVMLNKPDSPKLFTGYEKIVGQYADSYYKAPHDFEIVAKISRFSLQPDLIYLLVVKVKGRNEYDVIKVSHYEKKSDNHGYMRPYTYMDNKGPGSIINEGETVFRGNSLDENDNYRFGINAKVAYISQSENEEDAIICSESFADKTTFNLVTKTEYTINRNDIMLNIYGDGKDYKFMPMVGEYVNDSGILFASRKIDKKNMVSDLTDTALSRLWYNDNKFLGRGQVIDIDIKINNVSELDADPHREQLAQIYYDQLRYNQEIYNCLNSITKDPNNAVTYMLKQELFNASNYINPNVEYSSNSSKFEFAYITVYTSYETGLKQAFKLTNRCGGKGVIGSIWPDEYMPIDEHGTRAELIISTPSIVARANIAQSYEHAFNYCSDHIIRNMKKLKTTDDRIKLLLEYISLTNKEYYEHIKATLKMMNGEEKRNFIEEIFTKGIYLYSPPFHNALDYDALEKVKSRFKIKPGYIRMRREYKVSKDITDLYCDEQTFDSIKDLSDNYIWTEGTEKNDNSFGLEDLYNKNVKNAAKLPLNDYKDNKWTDDYVWGKQSVGLDTISKNDTLTELSNNIAKLSTNLKFEDRIAKEFNSNETKVFKKDDTTLVREFRSTHPIVIADIYYLVLKHVPDNSFSARFLGNITPLGIPNKAFNKAESGRPHSNTCNKMSDMDNCNLKRRCDPEIVARYMATSSTNPEYRSIVTGMLLTNDPLKLHNMPINNSEIGDTIPAKMFNSYANCLGVYVRNDGEKDHFAFLDNVRYNSLDKLLKIPPKDKIIKK